MRQVFTFNAKQPDQLFAADTATKRQFAPAELRELAEQGVELAYRRRLASQAST